MMQFIAGNQIKLLRSGGEYFPALITAIRLAKTEIHLQSYIFQADETGQAIGQALTVSYTHLTLPTICSV